jgi:regulator of sirC expression with transglutaminase-like and TPR domain
MADRSFSDSYPQHAVQVTPLQYFAQLMADNGSLPLAEAAISLAQDAYPQLDVLDTMTQIDAFAATLKRRLPQASSAETKLRYLNRFFFKELGFCGNQNDYYAVDNSYIQRVLHTRRGIPISLAVIYLEIAQQIGLRAHGVNFPGHFLVKVKMPVGDVVLDPFTGASLSRELLEEWLHERAELNGSPLPLSLFLKPATGRDIIARMLRNLKAVHRQEQRWEALLAVSNRLIVTLPDDPSEVRDRGLVQQRLGNLEAAIADLKTYLARDPDARDAALVEARVLALQGRK